MVAGTWHVTNPMPLLALEHKEHTADMVSVVKPVNRVPDCMRKRKKGKFMRYERS
jgi:hypothetical protein